MPRFAILAHDYPTPHWDLFLEAGLVLRTWRILSPLATNSSIPAEPIADHRLLYLDYEGPVSGGRGTVTRIDSGFFSWDTDRADLVIVHLEGSRFVGRLTIELTVTGWESAFQPD